MKSVSNGRGKGESALRMTTTPKASRLAKVIPEVSEKFMAPVSIPRQIAVVVDEPMAEGSASGGFPGGTLGGVIGGVILSRTINFRIHDKEPACARLVLL